MILEFFMDLISYLIITIFGILPSLPSVPQDAINSINSFLDLIFSNVGLIGIFLPLNHVRILVPLIIIVMNFENIYHCIMWVLKKIPTLNIK